VEMGGKWVWVFGGLQNIYQNKLDNRAGMTYTLNMEGISMLLKGKICYSWNGGVFPYSAIFVGPAYSQGEFAAGESFDEARVNLIGKLKGAIVRPDEEIELEV
jgi:hypothetical protein